jgi:hypothetical protein
LLATQHMRTRVVERVSYGALFGQRRGFYKLPRVDLSAGRRAVPAQPAPVPLGPGSMLGTLVGYVAGPHVLTGEELDTLRMSPCLHASAMAERYCSRRPRTPRAQHRGYCTGAVARGR